jgi:hypothetical protein
MSMVQLGAFTVTQASHNRARELVENKPEGRKSAQGVLESLDRKSTRLNSSHPH